MTRTIAVKLKPACSRHVVWPRFTPPRRCKRPGSVHERGAWWCAYHAPSATEKRQLVERTKYKRSPELRAANERIRKLERALVDYCLDAWMTFDGVQRKVQQLRELKRARDDLINQEENHAQAQPTA